MKIGIMGGTFNPPHFGHLLAAEAAREGLGLQKVLFIPTGNPPHKNDNELAEAVDRFHMVELAVSSNPWFEAIRIEINRKGNTYSVDTLNELKKVYGNDVSLYYIVGADIVNELTTWKNYETVFSLCEFIAVTRPGFDIHSLSEPIRQFISDDLLKLRIMKIPMLEISSSDIRERLGEGRSIRYLTPDDVEKYIAENRLYINDR